MKIKVIAALMLGFVGPAQAQCQVESGLQRARILELYTSEGCSSCPPADRWLADLDATAMARAGWIPLAFHVDYWDRLGWIDRFAQAGFSARQRQRARPAGLVYTPQFMQDGNSVRPVGRAIPVHKEAAGARLVLDLQPEKNRLAVAASALLTRQSPDARVWLALYENGLSSRVGAGENAGRNLTHDYVVRSLAGPFAPGAIEHAFALAPDWNRAGLGVAAWVERADGSSLQAVAASGCQSAR